MTFKNTHEKRTSIYETKNAQRLTEKLKKKTEFCGIEFCVTTSILSVLYSAYFIFCKLYTYVYINEAVLRLK